MSPSRREFLTFGAAALAAGAVRSLPGQTHSSRLTGREVPGCRPLDELQEKFLSEHEVPGMAVAAAYRGQLVYSRGCGAADIDAGVPIAPETLFRIASLSKPVTAVAVLQLVEQGRVDLDAPFLEQVPVVPFVAPGATFDPRMRSITVRHLLQHTAGWDRAVSFDPIGRPRQIATAMGLDGPPSPVEVTRFALGLPLDFDPGTRYAYANVDYLCLGRLIEHVTQRPYVAVVQEHVLQPLGVTRMRLGRALLSQRLPDETRYYPRKPLTGPCLYPPQVDEQVPIQYGAENLEGYEAHGGWIASAEDMAKFAAAFANPAASLLLKPATIETMWSRPSGNPGQKPDGTPQPFYYGCGWSVRPVGTRGVNAWHTGRIAGTSTLLVRRWDGWSWAVLFNADTSPSQEALASLIDPLMHSAVDRCNVEPGTRE